MQREMAFNIEKPHSCHGFRKLRQSLCTYKTKCQIHLFEFLPPKILIRGKLPLLAHSRQNDQAMTQCDDGSGSLDPLPPGSLGPCTACPRSHPQETLAISPDM